MKGFLIGRLKNRHNQTVALKIYFPVEKCVWLIDAEEIKRRYREGVMPEVVGIKYREIVDMDQVKIHICGTNGVYSAQKVDHVNGKGEPINGVTVMWNVIGIKGFEEFKKYVCVNSACEVKEFEADEVKKLMDEGKINGARLVGGAIHVQKACGQQMYDF